MADKVPQNQKPTEAPPVDAVELEVLVASSNKKYFNGKARSVSSVNTVGPFDVLPRHENFVSLVKDKVTIYDSSGKKLEYPIEHGLLEVSENKVRVFVGI